MEAFCGLTLRRLDLLYSLSLGLKGYSGSMADVLLQDAMGGHHVVLRVILEDVILILAPQLKVALQLWLGRGDVGGEPIHNTSI